MLLSKVDGIDLWKDPPYMLGGVEIPGIDYGAGEDAGTDLGAPDESLTLDKPLLPDRYTNRYEIKIDGMIGDDVTCYRYMRMNIPLEGEDSFSVYCWITDVIRNAATAPACIIRYEIDYWRTYLPKLSFGRGEVTRCGIEEFRRPYNVQPRHRKIASLDRLVSNYADSDCLWIIIKATASDDDDILGQDTQLIKTYFMPALIGGFNEVIEDNGTSILAPGLHDAYQGWIDEMLGLDPAAIQGAWVSPLPPTHNVRRVDTHWERDSAGIDIIDNEYEVAGVTIHMGCFVTTGAATKYELYERSLDITPDDVTTYAVTDADGTVYGFLPYGINITSCRYVLDIGPGGGYLRLYFMSPDVNPSETSIIDGSPYTVTATSVGCAFSIPLPQIPIFSNAMSSYAYSGQRDFDKENAQVARDQSLVNGLSGIVGNTAQATIGGALAGGPIGAAAGAIVGSVGTLVTSGVNYGFSGYFNDRLQDAKDKMYAKQASQLLVSGGSDYWTLFAYYEERTGDNTTEEHVYLSPILLGLEMDAVSAAEYEKDIELNGYETQIAAEDVTPFVQYGGPLRIENMKIGGEDVPYLAIASIKDMFSRGVFIINPPEEEEP